MDDEMTCTTCGAPGGNFQGDCIYCADRPKLLGWAIIDRMDVIFKFEPVRQHFHGTIIDSEEPTEEYIRLLNRDWAGLAPFRIQEVYE